MDSGMLRILRLVPTLHAVVGASVVSSGTLQGDPKPRECS